MSAALPPLAERMRPRSLAGYVGQEHITGQGTPLRQAIETGNLHSLVLWGPPGTGKTTLARVISHQLHRPFYQLSAISSGVKDIREVFESAARHQQLNQGTPVLFIDEIHRFNKSQQDSLLGAVEQGLVTLIGATTENPSFEVNAALLSRCQVYVLKELNASHLTEMASRALKEDEVLAKRKIEVAEWTALLRISGGDGRKLLNGLEIIADSFAPGHPLVITDELVQRTLQKKLALYDKSGEQHYDIVSAFIKSMRGSDPNAAVYWLARMIQGGEDPLFIARRMLILASEDIGNANPTALVLANACFQAVQSTGYPECRIVLSQTATYLACSPKSNAAYMAIENALALAAKTGDLPVPLHIRNAPTRLMKDLGYGTNYDYAHNHPGNFAPQEYLPEQLSGTTLYEPGQNPRENEMKATLVKQWKAKYGYAAKPENTEK